MHAVGDDDGVYGLGARGYCLYGQTTSGFAGVYGTGTQNGVYGLTSSVASGVYGQNTGSGPGVYGTGTENGVIGVTSSNFGSGVRGNNSAGGAGVIGESSGYGVFSYGNMAATGAKPFRIDHPDDPANKYLLHYAAESPEVINFYRGNVVLDGAGEAIVELPHYFAKINKTPSYQLTAVGAPMPMLHVAEEIDEAALSAGATAGPGVAAPACTFRIAGGAPGAKVSWRVEAVRNDMWARNRAVPVEAAGDGLSIQTRAMPVEVEKQGIEKGTYQHPEFYGQPPEKGMNYDAERERTLHTPSPDATPD